MASDWQDSHAWRLQLGDQLLQAGVLPDQLLCLSLPELYRHRLEQGVLPSR